MHHQAYHLKIAEVYNYKLSQCKNAVPQSLWSRGWFIKVKHECFCEKVLAPKWLRVNIERVLCIIIEYKLYIQVNIFILLTEKKKECLCHIGVHINGAHLMPPTLFTIDFLFPESNHNLF